MPRFEMLGGRHTTADGKTHVYKEGRRTIVTSDYPLDKMFKNSFRRLDESTKVPSDHRNSPDTSGGQVMDDLVPKKKVKKRVILDDESDEVLVDVTTGRKKAVRANKIDKDQRAERMRSVLRDDDDNEDGDTEHEEDEDLDELDEDEVHEEETDETEDGELSVLPGEGEEVTDSEEPKKKTAKKKKKTK